MTAADVKIAVEAHMINMQDEKFSQDAHFYAAEKEKKVGAMDTDLPAKVGKKTTVHRMVPETQADVDVPSGEQSIALTVPVSLSDVGNPTKPPPVNTFGPESQQTEAPLMGGTSTSTTPPAKLEGPSNTTDKSSIVAPSPAKLTTKSTAFPSGSKLKEILAEKIKKAKEEIQSLQQEVKAQEARKPVVMNTQKPRSHNLNLAFIKNKAQQHPIKGKEAQPNESITESDGPDCGRGTYRQQDMHKSANYMRSIGLKPLHNNRYLPKNPALINQPIPTFYVGDSFGDDLVGTIRYSTINQYTYVPPSPKIAPTQTRAPVTNASLPQSKKDELARSDDEDEKDDTNSISEGGLSSTKGKSDTENDDDDDSDGVCVDEAATSLYRKQAEARKEFITPVDYTTVKKESGTDGDASLRAGLEEFGIRQVKEEQQTTSNAASMTQRLNNKPTTEIEILTKTVIEMQKTLELVVKAHNPTIVPKKKEREATRTMKATRTTSTKSANEHAYDDSSENNDESDDSTTSRSASTATSSKKRDGTVKNWIDGKKRSCPPWKIWQDVCEATVDAVKDINGTIGHLGWAVIMDYENVKLANGDYGSIFSHGNEPTADQSLYHEFGPDRSKPKQPPRVPIFEGVKINSSHGIFETVMSAPKQKVKGIDVCEPKVRHMMKPLRAKTSSFMQYQELYIGQMNDVIQGMFPPGEQSKCNPGDPANWMLVQNIVFGGVEHQHPHCDQGKTGCFQNEDIFPFVCIHGFGMSEFDLWILPAKKKREYGFLYRFPPKAMVFLKGDCVHAGGCRDESRAHMVFFPLKNAGWKRSKFPYWFNQDRYEKWTGKDTNFLVQDLRTFPFAFPHISEEKEDGSQIVTYPPQLTEALLEDLYDSHTTRKRQATDSQGKDKGRKKYQKIDYSKVTVNVKW